MKYELVIFDLDGTLLDTLDDLAAAANSALERHGFPKKERDEVRRMIGNGVASMIQRAVPEGTDEGTCADVLADFKAIYTADYNVHTRPFPGVDALLDDLTAAGVKAAMNSNKVDAIVKALAEAHFRDKLTLAMGEREGIPKKPAPDGANAIMSALGVLPERTLYVGDGEADILTAQNAGIDCVWVSWGYRRPEELPGLTIPHCVDTVKELRTFILG